MPDLIETLATEGGKELVKVLSAGLLSTFKKIPALWRRVGKDSEARMAAELERTAADLAAAGEDNAKQVVARAEITWETRLRDLLASHPETRQELENILAEIRRENLPAPTTVQNITASGQNSTAQGVIGGNINNYQVEGNRVPPAPSSVVDGSGEPR